MHNTVLVRYGEISLKKGNTRVRFERALIRNMKASLRDEGFDSEFKKEWGRIFIDTDKPVEVCKAISRVFGIVSSSPAWRINFKTKEDILDAGMKYSEGRIEPGKSFVIRAKRAGNHSFTSMDIARELGAKIVAKYGVKVNLKTPDITIYNETRQKEAYFYSEDYPGPGGLPLGVEGKVMCLISGGIDSPVAAWLVMKRGCAPVFVHYENKPFAAENDRNRVKEVMKVLGTWSHGFRLKVYFVPHGKNLEEFMKAAPRALTCILCKRMMMRIAERLANKEKALALVTGSNLGQVASQTLTNIAIINQAVRIPVLSPLIGMDKEEIVRLAEKIGTYQPSITGSGCTAAPEHPETAGELDVIEDEENFIGVEKLVEDSLKGADVGYFPASGKKE